MTGHDESEELSWLAYCYVTDELDEAEQGAFEARLLHDPEACLAVSQVVELIGVCQHLESNPGADRPGRGFPRKRSVIALTTLVAAAAILLATISIPWNPPPVEGESAGLGSIPLEHAWVELQRDAHPLLLDAATESGWGDPPSAEDDDLLRIDPEGDLAPDPPQWLLVAVDRDPSSGDPELRSSEN